MRGYDHNRRVFPGLPVIFAFLAGIAVLVSMTGSCHYYSLERALDTENRDWLNKMRYIITSEERKMFLDIPESEREAFKEEFWAKRDPDPTTEENEFKMEYENRIERADELFVSEGRPGWMTDRGRIFILFGPPMDRMTYPQSYSGVCQEIWYYGQFPVVFVDESCTGHYELVTYNLTAMRAMNLMYMHELGQAQARAQQTIRGRQEMFNFDWDVKAGLVNGERVEGMVSIRVPLANVWFSESEGLMTTVLDVRIEVQDAEENLIWEFEQSYDVQVSEEELEKKSGMKYAIEIPLLIEKDIERLRAGRNVIFATLINQTGEARVRKALAFKFGDNKQGQNLP